MQLAVPVDVFESEICIFVLPPIRDSCFNKVVCANFITNAAVGRVELIVLDVGASTFEGHVLGRIRYRSAVDRRCNGEGDSNDGWKRWGGDSKLHGGIKCRGDVGLVCS